VANTDRLHALDALRAFALLAGIALHATMSFFLPIPAADSSQSVALGVTFYVIHVFRMSTFYLIAGFFAHLLLERRGLRGFVRDRARRIAAPMVVGWIVLAPPTILITFWGLARTFADGPPAAFPDGLPEAPIGFPLTHLWFLYYLCIFYAAAIGLRALVRGLDGAGRIAAGADVLVRFALRSGIAPLLLAAPTAVLLFSLPEWQPWFGIPTPDTGLAPKWPATVAYGTAFGFGWLLHRQLALLATLRSAWPAYAIAAVALTAACLAIVGLKPDLSGASVIQEAALPRMFYAAGYTLAVWCWTFGFVGAALRFFSAPSATRRYLADASYWLYLLHLPVVFVLQGALMNVPWHWSVKFPLILAITMAVLLLSYDRWVRPSVIGAWLNGRRYARSRRASIGVAPAGGPP
jgi:peptidoglycan/LPS O-acetylase OafA/YrhL